MLARRVSAPLEGALVGETARALEKELGAFAPAQAAPRIVIDRHVIALLDPAPFGRAATVMRDGCHVLDRGNLEARRLQRADGGLPARAGTLHPYLDALHSEIERLSGAGLGRHLGG